MYFDINNDRHKIYFAKEMTSENTDKDIIIESIDEKNICVTDIDENHHVSYSYSNKCIEIEMDIYNSIFNKLNSNNLNGNRAVYVLDFEVSNLNFDFHRAIFEMLNGFGISVDIVSNKDTVHYVEKFKDLDVGLFFDIDNVIDNEKYESEITSCFFKEPREREIYFSLNKYLESNNPSLIMCDNYYGLKAINKANTRDIKKLVCIPKYYKWNISDLVDSSYENNEVSDFLSLINSSSEDIDIAVCSDSVKKIISKYIDREDVIILDNPSVSINDVIKDLEDSKQGILCIGDNSEGSNYDELMKVVSPTGIPITFICDNPDKKVNGVSLTDLIVANKISSYNVIDTNGIVYIDIIMKMHRVMIDLKAKSNDYFIKKAMSLDVDCIVGSDSICDVDGVSRMNTDELIQSIKVLISVYGNPYNTIDLDFDNDTIKDGIINSWKNYMEINK